jgi:hypothetical protein
MKTLAPLLIPLALTILLGMPPAGVSYGQEAAQPTAPDAGATLSSLDQRLGRVKQGLGLLLTNARAGMGWIPRGFIKLILDRHPRILPGPVLNPEQWAVSSYYREGLSYRPGLTRYGARWMAEVVDEQRRLDKLNWDHRGSLWVRVGTVLGRSVDPFAILLVAWLSWRLFRRLTTPREYTDPFLRAEQTEPFTRVEEIPADAEVPQQRARHEPPPAAPEPLPATGLEPSFGPGPDWPAATEPSAEPQRFPQEPSDSLPGPPPSTPGTADSPLRHAAEPVPLTDATATGLLRDTPVPLPDSTLPIPEPLPSAAPATELPSPPITEPAPSPAPPTLAGLPDTPSPKPEPLLATNIGALPGSDRTDAESELQMLLRLAEQGNAHAQLRLADRHLSGSGTERDPQAGIQWLRTAAEAGLATAQRRLAELYDNGQGVEKDADQAAAWYARAAEHNDAEAQYRLARKAFHGRGTARDTRQAADWLKRAAHQGLLEAKLNLAFAYAGGIGVERDPEAALLWLRAAAEDGDPEACMLMAEACDEGRLGLAPNTQQAIFWRTRAQR